MDHRQDGRSDDLETSWVTTHVHVHKVVRSPGICVHSLTTNPPQKQHYIAKGDYKD